MDKKFRNKKMILLFLIECFISFIIFIILLLCRKNVEWSIMISPIIMIFILISEFLLSIIFYYTLSYLIGLQNHQYIFFIINLIIYIIILLIIDNNIFNNILKYDGFMSQNYLISHLFSTIIILLIYFKNKIN